MWWIEAWCAENLLYPLRSTTQIWLVMMCHQYGISLLVSHRVVSWEDHWWHHRWHKLEIWPSALLCNIQDIRICMGEETIVSVAYECKRI